MLCIQYWTINACLQNENFALLHIFRHFSNMLQVHNEFLVLGKQKSISVSQIIAMSIVSKRMSQRQLQEYKESYVPPSWKGCLWCGTANAICENEGVIAPSPNVLPGSLSLVSPLLTCFLLDTPVFLGLHGAPPGFSYLVCLIFWGKVGWQSPAVGLWEFFGTVEVMYSEPQSWFLV